MDAVKASLTFFVPKSVASLGLTFVCLPPAPGPVVVKTVLQGSWVERHGIEAEDRLLALNGHSIDGMERATFMQAIRQRPLELAFASTRATTHDEKAEEAWETADNGTQTPPSPPLAQSEESVQSDDVEEAEDAWADYLVEASSPSSAPVEQDGERHEWFTLSVPAAIASLGLVLASFPPGPVFVKRILEGSWVEEYGVEGEDEIVMINGRDAAQMECNSFMQAMRARPLELSFARAAQRAVLAPPLAQSRSPRSAQAEESAEPASAQGKRTSVQHAESSPPSGPKIFSLDTESDEETDCVPAWASSEHVDAQPMTGTLPVQVFCMHDSEDEGIDEAADDYF